MDTLCGTLTGTGVVINDADDMGEVGMQ